MPLEYHRIVTDSRIIRGNSERILEINVNPLGIFAIIVALVVGYFGLSGSDFSFFDRVKGPLATGPGLGSEIQNPQPVSSGGLGGGGSSEEQAKPKPGESPYQGKISIASVNRSGERPEEEYVIIRYGGWFSGSSQDKPVDVTGWKIGSARGSEPIPRAFNIPEIDAAEQDIFLAPGGEVIIATGIPGYQRNFRKNQCTGYFNQTHSFTPSLSNSCPDDSPDRGKLLARGFNGACIEAIENISSCRTPQGAYEAAVIKSECIDYMNQNFSYSGCVKNFRDQKDFLENTWRASLRRSQKLFDPRHDRVILRDAQGLLVDEFEY